MKRVLVIGANGFIGHWLLDYLRAIEEIKVFHCARAFSGKSGLVCDVTEAKSVADVFKLTEPDIVFQLSGTCGYSDSRMHYFVNVLGALNILEAAAAYASQAALVFSGSAAEYGDAGEPFLPLRESSPENPQAFYGAAKLAQTRAVAIGAKTLGLRCVTVRPFNIIGPGLPRHYFLAGLATQLEQQVQGKTCEPIAIYNGTSTRDYLDVRDAVKALWHLGLLAQKSDSGMQIFNVCSGRETPIIEAAQRLATRYGDFEVYDAGSGQGRSAILRSVGCPEKLCRAVDWRPSITWEKSLDDYWEARLNLVQSLVKE